jgi:hypothetical protein
VKSNLTLLSAFVLFGCATTKPSPPSQTESKPETPAPVAPSAEKAPAVAPPAPVAPPAASNDLMPGTECTTAKVPTLKYDKDEHQVRLANGGFKMRLPKGWTAELERPELAVITAPESSKGVRPVFEIFVSPVCKKYESFVVHRRVAARGLTELLPAEETTAQIAGGQWNVGLGGQVGQSLILQDVVLKTKKGERALVLYATQLGDAKSFGLRASAVCPKPGKKEGPLGKCEKTYFDMLAKAEF